MTIILAIALFVSAAAVLTLIIASAEKGLVQKGAVKISINEGKDPLETESGRTLLNTLTSAGIFLPSACGGKGTCGTCTCRVIEGGGDLLTTEAAFISRAKAREHWRLACQVKVRENMKIEVPEEVFSVNKWDCEVVSNRFVATFIKEFTLRLPPGENLDFRAGGYVQIEIPPYEISFAEDIPLPEKFSKDWHDSGLVRLKASSSSQVIRAYSMANHPAEGNIIKLNVRIAAPPWNIKKQEHMKVPPGISSSYIFSRVPGDIITMSGPYGEFFINDSGKEMVYIGGGAGMAPLRSHIFHLFHTLKTKRRVSFWYGARSLREVFYAEEFRAIEKRFKNFSFNIALSGPLPEDRWNGFTGFIHNVVYEEYLKEHPSPDEIEFYMCGPPQMIDAADGMLQSIGVEPSMIRYDKF